MSACGGMSGLHSMSMGAIGSGFPMHNTYTFDTTMTRDIPPYRGNNIGHGFDEGVNNFRRLQNDALSSPNFALDYAYGKEKINLDGYNYGGYRPGRIF